MKFHHRSAATARYLVALGLLCGAAPVWAVGYTITDLGSLSGGYGGVANGINASGQVVGWGNSGTSYGHANAFLYSNGTMSDLGTMPGGNDSVASGINASGQVVGGATLALSSGNLTPSSTATEP